MAENDISRSHFLPHYDLLNIFTDLESKFEEASISIELSLPSSNTITTVHLFGIIPIIILFEHSMRNHSEQFINGC